MSEIKEVDHNETIVEKKTLVARINEGMDIVASRECHSEKDVNSSLEIRKWDKDGGVKLNIKTRQGLEKLKKAVDFALSCEKEVVLKKPYSKDLKGRLGGKRQKKK